MKPRAQVKLGRPLGRTEGAVRILYFRAIGALRDGMGERRA